MVGGVRVSGRLDEDLTGTLVVTGTGAGGALRVAGSGTLRGTLVTYRRPTRARAVVAQTVGIRR